MQNQLPAQRQKVTESHPHVLSALLACVVAPTTFRMNRQDERATRLVMTVWLERAGCIEP